MILYYLIYFFKFAIITKFAKIVKITKIVIFTFMVNNQKISFFFSI